MTNSNELNYNWTLKDANFTKDKGTVFSCFSCGGGSTMGYKLAGFDVIGCNEIDKRMMQVYEKNHKPKFSFLESIRTFKERTDLPLELYNLDILDGSPPCSTFSMVGNREADWGKEKKFAEGQSLQVLDTLFFEFIDLAAKLQPKVVIAENVKGLLMGSAKSYVREIYKQFDLAGYYCQHFLLNAKKMGVPQQRERVFFIALRKDLATHFLVQKDMFTIVPKLDLKFNEKEIPFCEIEEYGAMAGASKTYPSILEMWHRTNIGCEMKRVSGHKAFGCRKLDPKKVLFTIVAHEDNGSYHYSLPRSLTISENCKAGSFPLDYDFCGLNSKYIIGMSVPPLMTARIALEIYKQWLLFVDL